MDAGTMCPAIWNDSTQLSEGQPTKIFDIARKIIEDAVFHPRRCCSHAICATGAAKFSWPAHHCAAQVWVRSDPPMTHRHAARRSAGCCFIHSASCGAPTRQDCTEICAKSDVVTIWSW